MTTFSILFQCLPGFFFLGCGLNFLLTAIWPSWRGKRWRSWTYFGPKQTPYGEHPWLEAITFLKEPKPDKEGDWDARTAVRLYLWMGTAFLVLGISLILAVLRASMV